MLAIPLMMALFPPRYTDTAGLIALMVFHGIAKLLEWHDHSIAAFLATGGHPWKHAAAAAGALCYLIAVERRRRLCYAVPSRFYHANYGPIYCRRLLAKLAWA